MKTSAVASSAFSAARPWGRDVSSTTPRLPRFSIVKTGLPGLSAVSGKNWRVASPAGLSTLTTSAPQSARRPAQEGPATHVDHSTTFRPDKSMGRNLGDLGRANASLRGGARQGGGGKRLLVGHDPGAGAFSWAENQEAKSMSSILALSGGLVILAAAST